MKKRLVFILILLIALQQLACDDTDPLPRHPLPTPNYSKWEVGFNTNKGTS